MCIYIYIDLCIYVSVYLGLRASGLVSISRVTKGPSRVHMGVRLVYL